ncbi:MAG: transporter [Hyphomicrobiales bacterium]|nr:transporter [Hyphomicrobiales bacterium]
MSDLLSPASTRTKLRLGGRRNDDTLTTIVVAAFIIAALYLGRQIFVPIAIAVLLSFVLAPAVLLLRRWRVARSVSVLIVVFVAFSFIFGLGTIITRQVSDLANELPRYQVTIAQKMETVRNAATGSLFISHVADAFRSVGNPFARRRGDTPENAPAQSGGGAQEPAPEPVPVEVHQPAPGPMEMLQTVASTVLEPLATAGIVAIFIVFILMQREDLRDRMIRLFGGGDLHRTTVALDDAASRLSRFFLVQTALNAAFGVVIAIGLSIIGVPSPMLWGLLAGILRFVPYIGAFVSALGPIALAAAVDPGWSMAILTLALFLVLEPITGQVVEPLLYGHSTGLSPIAVVVSATFWTWLWGPIGLLLSTPLTVCLVVLGRHVERLTFLDIVLSDAPALTPPESFYQRMLAGDPSEAADQANDYLRTGKLIDFYDEIAFPSLIMGQADARRGLLDEAHQAGIRDTIGEVIDDLDEADLEPRISEADAKAKEGEAATPALELPPQVQVLSPDQLAPEFGAESAVLCVAARGPIDEAAASVLAQLLRKHGLGAQVAGAETLAPGRIGRLPTHDVALVCLSAFDADLASAHLRYAVRRIRRRLPHAQIVGCFWTPKETQERGPEMCANTGADICATSLPKALEACLEAARRKPAAEVEAPKNAVA